MELSILSMAIGLGVSFTLLYGRKRKWNTDKFRWIVTGFIFLIGLIASVVTIREKPDPGFYFLCVPLVYNCFDRGFKYLSIKKYNRDFYLYLRNSDEIDESFLGTNPHVKTMDRVFSVLLLIIIIGMMFLGVLLYRKSNNMV